MEAHLENRLDTPVRAVVTQLRGLIEHNQPLRVGLSRSLQYVFQDAQEAQVTQRFAQGQAQGGRRVPH